MIIHRKKQPWDTRARRRPARTERTRVGGTVGWWAGCACASLAWSAFASGDVSAQSAGDGHQVAPTLEEIRIEGEIAMPQVVFITARDQFQYPDERHRHYVLSAAEIAALAPVPSLVWVVGHERPSTLFPGESTLDDRAVPLPTSLPETDRR